MAGSARSAIGEMMDGNRITGLQWKVAILCALVMVLDGFDNVSIGFLIPYIAKDWHSSFAEIAAVFTAASIGSAIGFFCGGPLADRIGRRPTLILCTLAFGIFTAAGAYARNPADLVVIRTLLGIALGGAIPNAIALAVEYAPTRYRAGLVAGLFTVATAGMTLVGAITGWLAPQFGWQGVFLIGGAVPFAIGLYLIYDLPESIEFMVVKGKNVARATALLRQIVPTLRENWAVGLAAGASDKLPLARLFQEGWAPITLLIWVIFGVTQAEIILLNSFLPTMFKAGGMEIAAAVQGATAYQFGAIFGGIASATYSVGRPGPRVLAYLCITEIVSLVALVFLGFALNSFGAVLALSFITGAAIGACLTGMNGVNAVSYPVEMRGTAIGAVSAVGRVTGIFGPIFAGVLMTVGMPISWVFGALAAPLILGVLAILALRGVQSRGALAAQPAPAQ